MGKYIKPVNKPKKPEKFVKEFHEKSVKTLKQAIELAKKLGKEPSEIFFSVKQAYCNYSRSNTVLVRWYDKKPNPKYEEQLARYNDHLQRYVKYLDSKLDKSAKDYEKFVKNHNEAMKALLNKKEPRDPEAEKK